MKNLVAFMYRWRALPEIQAVESLVPLDSARYLWVEILFRWLKYDHRASILPLELPVCLQIMTYFYKLLNLSFWVASNTLMLTKCWEMWFFSAISWTKTWYLVLELNGISHNILCLVRYFLTFLNCVSIKRKIADSDASPLTCLEIKIIN